MTDKAHLLTVKNLQAAYQRTRNSVPIRAIDGVDLTVYANEILGIAGESGCGKSTLLKVLFGTLPPSLRITSGEVKLWAGDQVQTLVNSDVVATGHLRWKKMSYIPQSSMSVLNPVVTIKKQFRWIIRRHARFSEARANELMHSIVERVGLPARVLQSYPHQLSGGMRQRVVIAMATLLHPSLVLADEPTTGLDVVVQRGILEMLQEIQREFEMALVVVSHDMGIHYQVTDRTMVMYAGQIVELGPTDKVFKDPLHPYAHLLISSLPRLGDKGKREGIRGAPPSLAHPPSGCRFHPRCPFAFDACKTETPPLREIRSGHYAACHIADDLDLHGVDDAAVATKVSPQSNTNPPAEKVLSHTTTEPVDGRQDKVESETAMEG